MYVFTHFGRESLEDRHVLLVFLQAQQPFWQFVLIQAYFKWLLIFVQFLVLLGKGGKGDFEWANAAGFSDEDEAFGHLVRTCSSKQLVKGRGQGHGSGTKSGCS